MGNPDVIVVGAGLWGLASAYACAKRGLSVAVYEADVIGSGASGGVVGALSPHTPDEWNSKKQFQYEALESAETFWQSVDSISGLPSGYGRVGRIVPLRDDRSRALALARIDGAKRHWHGRFDWQVRESHPLLREGLASHGVIQEQLAARIYPAQAVNSLAQACRKVGVVVHEQRAVTGIEERSVLGAWGQSSARAVILAAGVPGFSLLNNFAPVSTGSGVKGQAALLDHNLGHAPQIFAQGVYVIPHENGTTAVGSTSEPEWDNATATDAGLDDVIAKAKSVCPSLENAPILQRWANLRPKARRRTPLLGPIPKVAGVYAALGGYKIGIGLAHKIGWIMADYCVGQPVELPRNFTFDWHIAR